LATYLVSLLSLHRFPFMPKSFPVNFHREYRAHGNYSPRCPFYRRKQTSLGAISMSAQGHEETRTGSRAEKQKGARRRGW
jgi:hypothetical protein